HGQLLSVLDQLHLAINHGDINFDQFADEVQKLKAAQKQ
ncbi:unnamed protein product, partial [Rotaria socialis]